MQFWFGQTFATSDLMVIALLVILEGVLSIDNALVLGLLAKRLPKSQQPRALSYGLIGALVFRILAIGTASFLLKWTVVKLLGGGYLVYIAVKHLFFESHEEVEEKAIIDAEGHPDLVDAATGQPLTPAQREIEISERTPINFGAGNVADENAAEAAQASQSLGQALKVNMAHFWWTVLVIELTDIAFAVDSILAAIALVGSPPKGTPVDAFHPKLWVVIAGGFFGVVLMRFAAAIFIRLLEKFPRFEIAAYLLVIVIGMKLLLDWLFNSDWTSWGGHWNHHLAEQYVEWLQANWIFTLPQASIDHPHLLDFHDLRRPECITFWLLMLVCFLVGFIPKRSKQRKLEVAH